MMKSLAECAEFAQNSLKKIGIPIGGQTAQNDEFELLACFIMAIKEVRKERAE